MKELKSIKLFFFVQIIIALKIWNKMKLIWCRKIHADSHSENLKRLKLYGFQQTKK